MTAFYTVPWAARTGITFCFAVCVLWQALALVLSFYRHPRGRKWFFETSLEALVLCQILACSLLHGQAINSFDTGFVAPTGYGALRVALFGLIAVTAVAAAALGKKPWPLLAILVSGMALPVMERLMPGAFWYLLLFALLYWLLRGVHLSMLRYRELKTSISALSIKSAIDSMRTGILFCEPDGFILLANARMLWLMRAISGKVRRNGRHFYELLIAGELQPACQRVELEGQTVCLLPDHSAWMFTKADLRIGQKDYCQLAATDVTERWHLTARLQAQNERLRRRGEELSETIASLHMLSREKETQRAKMRAHDILGQKLTLLLRALRSGQAPDSAALGSLAEGLLDGLKASEALPAPQDELDSLRQAFASIGVELSFAGYLPRDPELGRLVVDIARECATNAVRHGFATRVFLQGAAAEDGYHLEARDDGRPPPRPIVEGGGIGGMRRKVEAHGGALHITAHPRFVLRADFPGGGTDG